MTPLQMASLMQALTQKLGGRVNVLYSRGVVQPADLFAQMKFEGMTKDVYAGEACSGTPVRSGTATRIADYRTSNYAYVNLPLTTGGVASAGRGRTWLR